VHAYAEQFFDRVFPRPYDHALRWRGDAPAGLPVLRVAHYGDCSFREMPLSHGVHTPAGYPRYMAAALRERGLGMEFSSVVAGRFEDLPHEYPTWHLKLTGDPDVVLVHLGAQYRRLVVVPDTPRTLAAREAVGRRLGRHVFLGYRVVHPLARLAGRFSLPYAGAQELERFLAMLRERWPRARVAVVLPFPARAAAAARQHERARLVEADSREAAGQAGAEVIDLAAVVPGAALELRCANGYNLNAAGSAAVGEHLAAWALAALSRPAAA
jgi:hypothetical protein